MRKYPKHRATSGVKDWCDNFEEVEQKLLAYTEKIKIGFSEEVSLKLDFEAYHDALRSGTQLSSCRAIAIGFESIWNNSLARRSIITVKATPCREGDGVRFWIEKKKKQG